MNKKWHEEIPPQGVLRKEISSGSIVRIIGKSHKHNGFVVDDCLTPNAFDVAELTPLTAQEWWEFAPWQSIETAPIDTPIIIMVKGVVQDAVYAVNEKNEVYLWFNGEVIAYTTEIDKCLPLPRANHE